MKKYIIIIVSAASLFLSSCNTGSIAYNYTTVGEIYNLKKGMSLQSVSTTLGVSPYEFYTNFENGNKVVVYKYKKHYQEVNSKDKNTRQGLSGGKEKFREDGDLYVVFDQQSGEMTNYITDSGRKKAEEIIGNSNMLKLVKENPLKYKSKKKEKKK